MAVKTFAVTVVFTYAGQEQPERTERVAAASAVVALTRGVRASLTRWGFDQYDPRVGISRVTVRPVLE